MFQRFGGTVAQDVHATSKQCVASVLKKADNYLVSVLDGQNFFNELLQEIANCPMDSGQHATVLACLRAHAETLGKMGCPGQAFSMNELANRMERPPN